MLGKLSVYRFVLWESTGNVLQKILTVISFGRRIVGDLKLKIIIILHFCFFLTPLHS